MVSICIIIFWLVFLFVVFIVEFIVNTRIEKHVKELEARKGWIKKIDCELIAGDDKVVARLVIARNFGDLCTIFLFADSLVLAMDYTTKNAPEIMLENIHFVKMEKLLGKNLLLVNYTDKLNDIKGHKRTQIYVKGKTEDLLYVKNFIEERMNRPKIVDLTGGDQTEP